ncbi:MAG: ATP-binding protein [Syntrophales bacterium]|nr:ATP-binding protein [Syntrophales bacterium]
MFIPLSTHRELSILEAIPHPVLGLANERVVFANRAVENVFGWRLNEVVGREISFLFRGEAEYIHTIQLLDEVLKEQKRCQGEVLCRHRDGRDITCLLTATLMGEGPAAGNIVINFEDITQKKKLEEEKSQWEAQLMQAQKMEALGTLAGGIAHDFNNILGIIVGYTELASFEIQEDKRRRYLQQIVTAAERAKKLVQQILSFSRQREKEMKHLDVAVLVKETMQMLRASLPATIDIRTNVAKGDMTILANVSQIHQVIMNLCTNAAQAMHLSGGILTVEVTTTWMEEANTLTLAPGEYVCLAVKDTGTGIEKEILPRIFEPFFTTKKPGEGTGLGLSVVYGIVKAARGAVTVASTVGAGTQFHVYFPKTKGKEEPFAHEMPLLSTGKGNIIFVDDEQDLIDIGEKMLKSLGYTVHKHLSPWEALESLKRDPYRYDLLLTDMTMPGMTGVALAAAVRAIRPDLPIVICTGCSEWVDEGEIKRLNIAGVANKPLSKAALAHTVLAALKGEINP